MSSYKKYAHMDSDIIKLWLDKLSMGEIARRLDINVGVVRQRLIINGYEDCKSHSEGATRHYAVEADKLWDDIKQDLDDDMKLSVIQKKYHMTKQRLMDLFSRQGFDYDGYLKQKADSANEELKQKLLVMRQQGLSVAEMGEKIGKSVTTIGRYLLKFGLSQKVDRTDITDEMILADWNRGLSVNGIADKYSCSHDTIAKRLAKYGIHSERTAGIERHFDSIHDEQWDDIKADLDICVPISEVAVRHNMRYEAVYRMMERHGYQYKGLVQIDENKLSQRIIAAVNEEELHYLKSIRDFCEQNKNVPVVYTLSRFMNRSMKVVRNDMAKYDLFEFMGNNNVSVKVLRVLHDLDDLGVRYEQNNRTVIRNPDGLFLEIDIWLPDYNLGIEVNPSFTHSIDIEPFGKSNKLYHQKKSILAEQAGIGLIHLYDSDFIDEKAYQVFMGQIKCMISKKNRLGARQLDIREIDRAVSNAFLMKYHFQGGENSSFVRYGLFYKDELMGALCMGEARYASDGFEIIRYCMNPGYIIHGGFEKLFSHFLNTLNDTVDIISYMDLNKRMRSCSVYDRCGFEMVDVTTPDYVWYNQSGTDMKSRYSVMKQNLVKQGFDASKSEVEIMREQHYIRVFGAGAKRYVYHFVK